MKTGDIITISKQPYLGKRPFYQIIKITQTYIYVRLLNTSKEDNLLGLEKPIKNSFCSYIIKLKKK